MAAPRFRTILLGLFAGVALLLAMAGIYGVVSFSVSQRTSEIGLRMALGAQRSAIVRLTVLSGLRLTAVGVAAGCAAALAMSQVVSSMLFETTGPRIRWCSFWSRAAARRRGRREHGAGHPRGARSIRWPRCEGE